MNLYAKCPVCKKRNRVNQSGVMMKHRGRFYGPCEGNGRSIDAASMASDLAEAIRSRHESIKNALAYIGRTRKEADDAIGRATTQIEQNKTDIKTMEAIVARLTKKERGE